MYKKIFNNKLLIAAFIITAIIGVIVGFFIGKQTSHNNKRLAIECTIEDDVSDSIDQSFGWGKAPADIDIEAVNLIKGVYYHDYEENSLHLPAIRLSIKNNGEKLVNSFGVVYSFSDIDNKRGIGTYSQASGAIEPGWTSRPLCLDVSEQDYIDLIGPDNVIDFRVRAKIWAKTKGMRVNLYETVFEPYDLEELPLLND